METVAMTIIHLNGRVTPDGELQFDAPKNLPPGDVHITIETVAAVEGEDFTPAEIDALMAGASPMSGAEIVAAGLTGGWEELGIEDPVAWVEAMRV
jgi:hypothetical protein